MAESPLHQAVTDVDWTDKLFTSFPDLWSICVVYTPLPGTRWWFLLLPAYTGHTWMYMSEPAGHPPPLPPKRHLPYFTHYQHKQHWSVLCLWLQCTCGTYNQYNVVYIFIFIQGHPYRPIGLLTGCPNQVHNWMGRSWSDVALRISLWFREQNSSVHPFHHVHVCTKDQCTICIWNDLG